jgi:hypothetical protein
MGARGTSSTLVPVQDRHRLLVFGLLIDRSKRPLHGLIWPQGGCASIASAAMAPVNFLPLPAAPSFLAKQETSGTTGLKSPRGCTPVTSPAPAG